jgi:putative transposase
VSRQAIERKNLDGHDRELKSHQVGLQAPCSIHTEVSEEGTVCELRVHLGDVFRTLAQHKESRIEEGHLMPDHVHMMISIPPKLSVSHIVGCIKVKSAVHLARVYGEQKRNFVGQHFWARGYFVSTVGRDEQVIRNYIRHLEKEDEKLEQLKLWKSPATKWWLEDDGPRKRPSLVALSGSQIRKPGDYYWH